MADSKSERDLAATELKVALDNRAFEIQLFWQRSNYFLVLMTALGVATFSIKDALFSAIVSIFATAASYFWFRTNLGSRFWQESWEVEVVALAREQKIRSFERSTAEVVAQVSDALTSGEIINSKSRLRRFIDKLILKKYSVTYNMILLSMFATALWAIVAIILVYRFLQPHCQFDGWFLYCDS